MLTHTRERVLPDGYAEIIINLYEDRLDVGGEDPSNDFAVCRGSLIYGPHSRPFIINRSRPTAILGVHFNPGGLSPFLNLPVDKLHNEILPLDLIWGQDGHELRERLLDAASLTSRFQIVEEFLLAKLHQYLLPHPAVSYTLSQLLPPSPVTKMSDIVEQLGMSSRRFSQIFREQVGMTPKAFHRLQRFQTALHTVNQVSGFDWVDLALSCAYFDQAHFIHDFKVFSGLTPTAYYQQAGRRPGHVPVSS